MNSKLCRGGLCFGMVESSGFQGQKHKNIRPTALITVLQRAGPSWGMWRPGKTFFLQTSDYINKYT